eukprot:gene21049-27923_t
MEDIKKALDWGKSGFVPNVPQVKPSALRQVADLAGSDPIRPDQTRTDPRPSQGNLRTHGQERVPCCQGARTRSFISIISAAKNKVQVSKIASFCTLKHELAGAEVALLLKTVASTSPALHGVRQFDYWHESGPQHDNKLAAAVGSSSCIAAAYIDTDVYSGSADMLVTYDGLSEAKVRKEGWRKGARGKYLVGFVRAMGDDALLGSILWDLGEPWETEPWKYLVGYVRAMGDGTLVATAYDMAVHPSIQGCGVGTYLVRLLVQQLYKRGIYDIGLVAPQELRPFFWRASFDKDREDSTFMHFSTLSLKDASHIASASSDRDRFSSTPLSAGSDQDSFSTTPLSTSSDQDGFSVTPLSTSTIRPDSPPSGSMDSTNSNSSGSTCSDSMDCTSNSVNSTNNSNQADSTSTARVNSTTNNRADCSSTDIIDSTSTARVQGTPSNVLDPTPPNDVDRASSGYLHRSKGQSSILESSVSQGNLIVGSHGKLLDFGPSIFDTIHRRDSLKQLLATKFLAPKEC